MNSSSKSPSSCIDFEPVAFSSQYPGTSIQLICISPTAISDGWESDKNVKFPQELVFRFFSRIQIEYIIISSKIGKEINDLQILIGDGLSSSFVDADYKKVASAKLVPSSGIQIQCSGIGNFLKLIFPNPPQKTSSNVYAQVGISLLRIYGEPLNYYYQQVKQDISNSSNKNKIDTILLELGLPIDIDQWNHFDQYSKEYTPIDNDSRETLHYLEKMREKAYEYQDFMKIKAINDDIKVLINIGKEILDINRKIPIEVAKENFSNAVDLKNKLKNFEKKRDYIDALYETPKYERMISLSNIPFNVNPLSNENNTKLTPGQIMPLKFISPKKYKIENVLNDLNIKCFEPVPQPQKIGLHQNEDEKYNPQVTTNESPIYRKEKVIDNPQMNNEKDLNIISPSSSIKENTYIDNEIILPLSKRKNTENDLTLYNEGDKDLEQYLNPLLASTGIPLEAQNQEQLKALFDKGILQVFGAKLWAALNSESWRLREAASSAYLQFIEGEIPVKYEGNTKNLFLATIEVAKYCCNDKLLQIYFIGLKILTTALNEPICGPDIGPIMINKVLKMFVEILINKISELNYRAKDISLQTIISIFKHPKADIRVPVECLTNILLTTNTGPEKMPWRIILSRLEILDNMIKVYGIDENQWNWIAISEKLIFPCLGHQTPDVRYMSVELILTMYKIKKEETRNLVMSFPSINQNLLKTIIEKMDKIDVEGGLSQALNSNQIDLPINIETSSNNNID